MENINSLTPFTRPLSQLARFTGLRRVPDNCAVTVHRFGRFVRALGAGWRWTVPGLDRVGPPVCLIGHHLDIPAQAGASAELYYQILNPTQAGADLNRVDALVADQARDLLATLAAPAGDLFKAEINKRIAAMGLRVIRCALHAA